MLKLLSLRSAKAVLLSLAVALPCLCATTALCQPSAAPDDTLARARKLVQEFILVDTHIDFPSRISRKWIDASGRLEGGSFDWVRAREGGLDVPFMSIYVSPDLEGTGKAKKRANELIRVVRKMAETWPDKFAVVTSVRQVRDWQASGKVLLAMGMENGSPIEGDLENVRYFYDRGIRYITLAHAKNNHLSDASYDKTRRWNGLSPFGKAVVAEMNRVGIMVDVSHLSDSAFYQVVRASRAPVIASHSSCRYFTPGFERNMDDAMIRVLAANGGVIQINFGSTFLTDLSRAWSERTEREIDHHIRANGVQPKSKEAEDYAREYHHVHPFPFASVRDVADHIDHVVRLVGVDHVGIGSDFDGLGDELPVGLKDVSQYPNLVAELIRRDYDDETIRKICGGNLLRVWSAVEAVAAEGTKQ
jgi:membrane dipeptidase